MYIFVIVTTIESVITMSLDEKEFQKKKLNCFFVIFFIININVDQR